MPAWVLSRSVSGQFSGLDPSELTASLKVKIIFCITAVAVLPLFFTGPIPQDTAYHNFADQRLLFGIPDFWNVVSNIPYALIGIAGIASLLAKPVSGGLPELRQNYLLFFAGICLVGIGSAWYHWSPSNQSLVWDRLPMTIAFMAFFSTILGEYLSPKIGKSVLWPLILTGILSVLYWHATELSGHGDLRPYIVIQFLPMILVPAIMLTYKSAFRSNSLVWGFMFAYVIAKITEYYDVEIFNLASISGHTLKHLISAGGVCLYYLALKKRIALTEQVTGS